MIRTTVQAWDVVEFGKRIGIVEGNYLYARKYWDERTKATGFEYELIAIRVQEE